MDNSKKYGKLSVKFLASALSVVTLFPAVTPCANAVNPKEVRSVNSIVKKMKNVEAYAKELAKNGYKKISTLVKNHPKTVTLIATTLVLSAIVSVVFVCYKSHRDRRESKLKRELEICENCNKNLLEDNERLVKELDRLKITSAERESHLVKANEKILNIAKKGLGKAPEEKPNEGQK